LSDPITKPWEKYEVSLYDWDRNEGLRGEGHQHIAAMGAGEEGIDELREADSEGAEELIEAMAGSEPHYHLAANVPNVGQIANLPMGAIVETPAIIDGLGVHGVAVGSLPVGIAELCRREIAVAQLSVDAAVKGDRQLALQCLLLDPVITDMDVARQILDDYLVTYREHLPQFWQ
jgi:alpha-galactosidase